MSETDIYRVVIIDPDISDAEQNVLGEWCITDGIGLMDALNGMQFGRHHA